MSSQFPEQPLYRSVRPSAPPPSNDLVRLALRVGLGLVVAIVCGRCALGVTDRPRFLGLATASGGTSLRDARRVVVMLHGYGADKDDLGHVTPEIVALGIPEDTAFVFPEGPYRAGLGGRAWWATTDPKERAESVSRVNELLDDVLAKTGLRPDHVYLAGFSQGASLALEVALSRPDTLGGVVAFSPCRGNTTWSKLGSGHAPVRAVVAHGRADQVCSFSGGTELQDELRRAGHPVRLVAFDGTHRVTTEGEGALAGLLRGEGWDEVVSP